MKLYYLYINKELYSDLTCLPEECLMYFNSYFWMEMEVLELRGVSDGNEAAAGPRAVGRRIGCNQPAGPRWVQNSVINVAVWGGFTSSRSSRKLHAKMSWILIFPEKQKENMGTSRGVRGESRATNERNWSCCCKRGPAPE